MTQKLLHLADIGSARQQMGGEGVAEGMRADAFFEPDVVGKLFDDVENHDAGNVLSAFADEYIVFEIFFDGHPVSIDEIKP